MAFFFLSAVGIAAVTLVLAAMPETRPTIDADGSSRPAGRGRGQ
jgi:hypothetical protein